MHSKANHFSDAHCLRGHSGSIERNGDHVLVIHDLTISPHIKALSWIMSGSVVVIAVLSAITSLNAPAVFIPVFVLLGLIAAKARSRRAEINLTERTIRRTWKIGAFARHRVYSIDDYATAEIKEKVQVIEGYPLPFFSVQLIGRRKHITIYSTDDPEDAKAVYREIAGFLRKAGTSTQQQQSG